MKRFSLFSVIIALFVGGSAQIYLDPNAPVEERVKDALSRMTVHEKIQILHATGKFTSLGVPRLGIKELHHSDGPHGVRAEIDWNSWSTAKWNNDSIVAFPSLTCLAATWNREMSSRYGKAVGEEFAFRDKHILLGPGVTIARTPLNGRSFEYMGEDPYLVGEMATPYVQSVQNQGVACCLKHFFLNNQETDRNRVNVNVSERAINEIYLPAFKKVVQKGGLWTIMGSYNKWKHVYCCENDTLLNKILKTEWGFDGAVISDWGGSINVWESATGGLDLEMGTYTDGKTFDQSQGYNTYHLADPFEGLIKEGKIPMSVLDDKASRVLRTIFRTVMSPKRVVGSQCSEDHYNACREIGEEGIVLLKNSGILPLDKSKYKHILVVGENATRSLTKGGGSSELKTKVDISPLQAIKVEFGDCVDYAQGYYSGQVLYAKQGELDETKQVQLKAEALEKAKKADLIIFVGGLNKNGYQDCEAVDRKEFCLSFGQPELIAELARIQKNIVVVTFGGNPFETSCLSRVPAFVHCWYLGSMAGEAITNILIGKVNPSGKLPITWAKQLSDYSFFQYGDEAFPGVDEIWQGKKSKEVYYKEGIYVGYRHFASKKIKPCFPFGFGLSYTTFKLSAPSLVHQTGIKTFSVKVENTGTRAGKETIQLYISKVGSKVDRPVIELKGFSKVSLNPGESKDVKISLEQNELRYFDESSMRWVLEHGKYIAYLATSSSDLKIKIPFIVD